MIAKSVQQLTKELDERLTQLEKRKLKVKDLPLQALRKSLLTLEPSDPQEILLGSSITNSLLADDAVSRENVLDDAIDGSKLLLNANIASASADLVHTTTPTDVPGINYVVPDAGQYIIITVQDVNISVAGPVVTAAYPANNGTAVGSNWHIYQPTGGTGRAMTMQVHMATLAASDVITFQAYKLIGAGTSTTFNGHTTMAVLQFG